MRLIDADYLKEYLAACAMKGRPLHSIFAELTEVLNAIDEVPTVTADPDTVSRQQAIDARGSVTTLSKLDNEVPRRQS